MAKGVSLQTAKKIDRCMLVPPKRALCYYRTCVMVVRGIHPPHEIIVVNSWTGAIYMRRDTKGVVQITRGLALLVLYYVWPQHARERTHERVRALFRWCCPCGIHVRLEMKPRGRETNSGSIPSHLYRSFYGSVNVSLFSRVLLASGAMQEWK
ncbi:hypothetical protein BC939DRAFT_255976 [Gamsiella multidivaricata]|uniref:uncharacterized protein n=1 Tax=Gamsiella multidivaricata TaxID=101098 RepID=UPI00221F0672|nr:uncharacterized protein BC939DRAFT_255976 [Gamsiella multidivaricata]KAI7830581.1 hypothetical protein BC939DRAFT_255976 [Gamsiella multidivaricata]